MPKGSRAGKADGAPGESRRGGGRGRRRGWALRAAAPRTVCEEVQPAAATPRPAAGRRPRPWLERLEPGQTAPDGAGWGDGRAGAAAPVSRALTALPEAQGFLPVDQRASSCSCQGVLLPADREGGEERGMTTTFCLLLPTSPIYIFTKYSHLYLPNVPKYEAELRKPRPTKIMGSPLQWEVRGESRCQSPAVLHLLPPWVFLRRGLMGLGAAPDGTLDGAGEPWSFWAQLSVPPTPTPGHWQ